MSAAISLRAAVPDDQNYLLSTTREVLLKESDFCAGIHPETMSVILQPILSTYEIIVAAASEDPSAIVGFIVYRDPRTVAFLYVRSQFRKMGVGRALIDKAGIELGEIWCPLMVTRQNFQRFAASKGYRARFRPYMPLEIVANLHFPRHRPT